MWASNTRNPLSDTVVVVNNKMVLVLMMLAVFVIVFILTLHEKNTNGICKSTKTLKGKVAVVTGGTAGMGLEMATDLAKRGAKVIIACPFKDEGEAAKNTIIDVTGSETIVFKLLNLESLDSVKKFASDLIAEESRLDILINNAGVSDNLASKTIETNFIMQVNYVGHFLLTILLLPLLKESGTTFEPSRIVNTGSILHWFGTADFNKTNSRSLINRFFCYADSKYCCILFGHILSKKLNGSNVVVNSVDPGCVGTGIFASLPGGFIITFLFKNIFKTPREGAQTALHAALDEKAGLVTGQFFKNCKLSRAKESAYDDDLGRKLWQQSIKIVRLEREETK